MSASSSSSWSGQRAASVRSWHLEDGPATNSTTGITAIIQRLRNPRQTSIHAPSPPTARVEFPLIPTTLASRRPRGTGATPEICTTRHTAAQPTRDLARAMTRPQIARSQLSARGTKRRATIGPSTSAHRPTRPTTALQRSAGSTRRGATTTTAAATRRTHTPLPLPETTTTGPRPSNRAPSSRTPGSLRGTRMPSRRFAKRAASTQTTLLRVTRTRRC